MTSNNPVPVVENVQTKGSGAGNFSLAADGVYRSVPGWEESTVGAASFADLPAAARAYVETLEEVAGSPVGILSTGPRREETIVRDIQALRRLMPRQLDEVRRQV